MNIRDVIWEADDSGDYQQMQAFVKANRVGGVPADQQIPLALFKELKKQQAQNQALSRELSDAERRIDQATQRGELSRQELGLHRGELEREREAGAQQRGAVSALSQQYRERERASREQMADLTAQLAQVRNQPGVDKKAAQELEDQIKELGKKSVSLDQLAELETSIAQIQSQQTVDDSAVKDLIAQVKAAEEATKEISQTRQKATQDAEQAAQQALDQVTQMRQDIARLNQIETGLTKELGDLKNSYDETDATLWDIESKTLPRIDQNIDQLRTAVARKDIPVPNALPAGQTAATPQPPAANQPTYTPAQIATAKKLGLSGDLTKATPSFAMAESQLQRAIAWATGKTK